MNEKEIAKLFAAHNADISNDCALLIPPLLGFANIFVSTDSAVEGVHFLENMPPMWVGYRCFLAAASDISANAALPLASVVAVVFPQQYAPENIRLFAQGVRAASQLCALPIVGGNVTYGQLSLHTTVLGTGMREVRRDTAKVGDDVWVTGALGGSAYALGIWQGMFDSVCFSASLQDIPQELVPYFKLPCLQNFAVENCEYIHAMIDISDGFFAAIDTIEKQSGVEIEVQKDSLPLVPSILHSKPEKIESLLAQSDDYQLLFTAAPMHSAQLVAIAQKHGVKLSHVGYCRKSSAQHPKKGWEYSW